MYELNTNQLKFDKARKSLSIPRDSFDYDGHWPLEVKVVSAHTGRAVLFVQDEQAYLESEGWDGEQMEYIPIEAVRNVERLVIYNGY